MNAKCEALFDELATTRAQMHEEFQKNGASQYFATLSERKANLVLRIKAEGCEDEMD